MGYDADHPLSEGEVGMCGVAISSLQDMEILFDGIDLSKISVSMTINGPAVILFAFYVAVAQNQGVDISKLNGTLQNDILKEFIAQKEWIYPPVESMRIIMDMIQYCTKEMPKYNTISVSGYHIREAGSTAIQELAFTLADGFCYVEHAIKVGLDVDEFAAVLGGTQSLHTNSMDETLALPSQHAAEIALRTQQLIAFETGVTNVVDPLGGSWYVEELTDKMEKEAYNYFSQIDDLGGVIPAIEMGYFQREIAEAASDYQRRVDSKRRIVVGVNEFSKNNEEIEIPILEIRKEVEREQIEGLKSLREKRNEETVDAKLKSITDACRTKDNLIPLIIDAAQSHATLGELVTSMKVVFGEWQETAVV